MDGFTSPHVTQRSTCIESLLSSKFCWQLYLTLDGAAPPARAPPASKLHLLYLLVLCTVQADARCVVGELKDDTGPIKMHCDLSGHLLSYMQPAFCVASASVPSGLAASRASYFPHAEMALALPQLHLNTPRMQNSCIVDPTPLSAPSQRSAVQRSASLMD